MNFIQADMTTAEIIFWALIFLVFYAYLGYGLILFLFIQIKRLFKGKFRRPSLSEPYPHVTFMVAAFNEEDWIEQKIMNGLAFDYPKDKIHYLFVTDGCSDDTPDRIQNFAWPEGVSWELEHRDERRGKIAAVERVMPLVKTPIVIYTDANTMVNDQAIKNIAAHYEDKKVGAVAGEKRVSMEAEDSAKAAGEGIYWKYESQLKKWDSELYSVVGAAGELFSVRTELFQAVPQDTVIEDFYMTLKIAMQGYTVRYEPGAYAVESSSASVGEELKRKIRIAAGGLQAISRLTPLLNIFKYGVLSFQYVSHRVLRWTLAPIALPIILLLNIYLALNSSFYGIVLLAQVAFYLSAIIGYILEKKTLKVKAFFIPYYFCVMNYAVLPWLWPIYER